MSLTFYDFLNFHDISSSKITLFKNPAYIKVFQAPENAGTKLKLAVVEGVH